MLKISKQNWWETDTYSGDFAIPQQFLLPENTGPQGPALVEVFPSGATQKGWGLNKEGDPGFIARYTQNEFAADRSLRRYTARNTPFAFVMRSLRVMCVDIDGKNGGLESVGRLGGLPYTLAETSKSGNGYHLFYSVPDDLWDDDAGFSLIPDQIGITQGVDIRGVGCVYHHATQRWNNRELTPIPAWLQHKLLERKRRRAQQQAQMQHITTLDEMERIMAYSELQDELARPIAAGKRNTTLFAIGCKMNEAQVPDWQDLLSKRADEIGLSATEAEKIIENIVKYGA